MTESLQIETFNGWSDQERYDEYRRLRYQVFVAEQGWTGLSHEGEPGMAMKHPADEHARFWLARNETGAVVGEVRVVSLVHAFPHKELFATHLRRCEMQNMLPFMGTLNSLAVLPWYRGLHCQIRGDVRSETAARALLRASLQGSTEQGLRALIATAQNPSSARALVGAGFRMIDTPIRTALHPHFLMANVGVVLEQGDQRRSRVRAAAAGALARYFNDRQREVLASVSLDALLTTWAKAA